MSLQPYGSKVIQPLGEFTAITSWGKRQTETKWVVLDNHVLEGKVENIPSCSSAEALGILQINTQPNTFMVSSKPTIHPTTQVILNEYGDVFIGLGKMKTDPVTLYTKPDTKPIIQPPRHIPYHLQEQFSAEIQRMEDNDVIEDHDGPVTWVSNPVLIPKADGNLRITVDLRQVNKSLQNPHLPIPRVDDILPTFTEMEIFSKCDLKTAFHQIELHEESRHLTVFRAGNRLKRYKRLAMGSLSASGELNKRLHSILANIIGAEIIHDDIVIATKNLRSHNSTLRKVLETLKNLGLTLNKEKCIIASISIPF